MPDYFVTATGTDIGKTHFIELVCRQARHCGKSVCVRKPLLSGTAGMALEETDPGRILKAQGRAVTQAAVAQLSPWRFAAHLAPDMAAARENREISFEEVVAFCGAELAASTADLGLIEGVGGVMAPITRDHTMLDWIVAQKLPVLLVAGSYLGTISHTLTAAQVLSANGVAIAKVILSESPEHPVPLEETADAIARFAPGLQITPLPRAPAQHAPDLLDPLL